MVVIYSAQLLVKVWTELEGFFLLFDSDSVVAHTGNTSRGSGREICLI